MSVLLCFFLFCVPLLLLLRLLRTYVNRQTLICLRNLSSQIHKRAQNFFFLDFVFRMSQPSSESEVQITSADDPPPFDPTKPSIPISYPIKTLEELESRSYFESFHYPFNKASVALQSGSSSSLPRRRRLLVCHDMAGGYGDDKWVQGGTNADAYAIWHWYLIDVFVYFSHSLVTLPPPCWVNTAHKHGVKVNWTFEPLGILADLFLSCYLPKYRLLYWVLYGIFNM